MSRPQALYIHRHKNNLVKILRRFIAPSLLHYFCLRRRRARYKTSAFARARGTRVMIHRILGLEKKDNRRRARSNKLQADLAERAYHYLFMIAGYVPAIGFSSVTVLGGTTEGRAPIHCFPIGGWMSHLGPRHRSSTLTGICATRWMSAGCDNLWPFPLSFPVLLVIP